MKVLGPTPDFPTWGSKRDWEPPGNLTFKSNGIWLQNFCRTRETDLKGTHKTVCILGPRRKEKWPHKSQTCLWVFGSLQQRHGSTVACYGVRTLTAVLEGAACWHKSFWRRSPLSLAQFGFRPNYEREHSPTHQQKIGLQSYWSWPCPLEQDLAFSTASPSHQEASTSLLYLSIRGQTEWKPQSQKTH